MEKPDPSSRPKPEQSDVCEICGAFDPIEVGDRRLCERCHAGCGSCCPEFGRENETDENESQKE